MSANLPSAAQLIAHLELTPLPREGGYYRETYRCSALIPKESLSAEYDSVRNVSTAIYYLLTPDNFSALHRVLSDEIFHFYLGDPVEMLLIDPQECCTRVTLGSDLLNNQHPQQVVPAGHWQALRLFPGGRFALFGTTVAPGFEFQDFELATSAHFTHLPLATQAEIASFIRS